MLIFLNLNLGHRDDIRHRDDILTTGGCESSHCSSPRENKNVQGELNMELSPEKEKKVQGELKMELVSGTFRRRSNLTRAYLKGIS